LSLSFQAICGASPWESISVFPWIYI